MNQPNTDNQTMTSTLADLEADRAEEIRGGPKRIFIGGLSVATPAGDGPLPQTREHILLARQTQ